MRMLNGALGGGLDVIWDQVEKDDFYHDIRAQIQCDALWPAYELMYPRDEKAVTKEILEITGMRGIGALWCDGGRPKGRKLYLPARHCPPEIYRDFMVRQGFYTNILKPCAGCPYTYWEGIGALRFAKTLIEIVHISMRGKLREFIEKYEPTKPLKRPRAFHG